MLQNTNFKFVAKLAKKSYKSNNQRNYISIIATILTAFMIISVFSLGASYIDSYMLQQQQLLGTIGNATLNNVTDEQLEYLKKIDEVNSVGIRKDIIQAGSVNAVGENLGLYYAFRYYDQEEWLNHRLPVLENVVGTYPTKEDEIMLPSWYLKKIGINQPKLGSEFVFEYNVQGGNRQKIFSLSGYFDEYDNAVKDGSVVYALVSDSFVNETEELTNNEKVLADITFSKTIEEDQLKVIELGLNLKEEQTLKFNPDYKSGIKEKVIILLGAIVLSIMICGYLLITNIFNISVMNDIFYYGQLKTIGVTKKQIKLLIILQGFIIFIAGGVSGSFIGIIFSKLIVPMILSVLLGYDSGVVVKISSTVVIGTLLFTGLTIYIAVIKPAAIACKIEPIDSLRYESKHHSKKKMKRNKPTIFRMAYQNVLRDLKRFIFVVLSVIMGITITLLITVFVSSMNTENYVKNSMKSDIELKNKTTSLGYTEKIEQIFSKDLINQIRDVEGIDNISLIRQQVVAPIFDEKVFGDYVRESMKGGDSIDVNYFADNPQTFYSQLIAMEINESIRNQNPDIDWNAFDNGEICLIPNNNEADIGEEIVYKIAKYKELKSSVIITNQSETIKIGGTLPVIFNNYGIARTLAPNIIVSLAYMNRVVEDAIITNIMVNIKDSEDKKNVNTEIKDIINEASNSRNIVLVSAYDKEKGLEETKLTLYTMGGSLAVVLGIIGILNFINVIITSVNERRREFTIMESIGVSQSQIIQIVQVECLLYLGTAFFSVITVGNIIIGIGYKYFANIIGYAEFSYPIVLLIGILVVFLGIGLYLPFKCLKCKFRIPITERIEINE